MARFAIVTTLPYQERAIVNLDAIATVTSKTGPDGARTSQLGMLDGSKLVTIDSFADLRQALSATPLQDLTGDDRPPCVDLPTA